MVTSAQATARGVSHVNLARLAESGDLTRLTHGVYKDAGAPSLEHQELRAAWLAIEPKRLAWERLRDRPSFATVAGESAAVLHGIGDLRAMRSEFITRARKQSQRDDVRYRERILARDDVTVQDGLPVLNIERTIADLVETRTQLEHVGNALRDAARKTDIDAGRLVELLSPLAARNGHRKGDGEALLGSILESAGIDQASLANQLSNISGLASHVVAKHIDASGLTNAVQELAKRLEPVVDERRNDLGSMSDALLSFSSSIQRSLRTSPERADEKALSGILKQVEMLTLARIAESSGTRSDARRER